MDLAQFILLGALCVGFFFLYVELIKLVDKQRELVLQLQELLELEHRLLPDRMEDDDG